MRNQVQEYKTIELNGMSTVDLSELRDFLNRVEEAWKENPNENLRKCFEFKYSIESCDTDECGSKYESCTGLIARIPIAEKQ